MVKLKIESNNGHDVVECNALEAMQIIRQETQENGKWLLVDNAYKTYDSINISAIELANSVTLIKKLKGG